jgi:predicted nucleic acid-binding Zn ribbon protein
VRLAMQSAAFDAQAMRLWRGLAERLRGAVRPWLEPSASALMEDYTVFVLPSGDRSAAGAVDRTYAHVLLGEPDHRTLASSTVQELARRTIRYYADDLVLVDYDAAIVVDREGGADLVDIFEVASAQLLELRFYDALLGRALETLLTDMRRARTTSWFFRSPFTMLARRAAILALELGEMTDRLERAITLVGDTYSSQIYRETALRFRLGEASASVREKVTVIDRAAEVLSHEIQGRRDLVLEVLVILLIALEVVLAVRG